MLVAHEATYPSLTSDYGPDMCSVMEAAAKISLIDLAKAHILRDQFAGQMADVFRDIDVLLIPVWATPAPSIADWAEKARGDIVSELIYSIPFNLTGMPSLTMNGGLDKRGVPIGFQLVGKHLSEDLLLRAGHAFQSITDWHTRHPALD